MGLLMVVVVPKWVLYGSQYNYGQAPFSDGVPIVVSVVEINLDKNNNCFELS